MLHWFAKRLNEVQREEAGFTLVELLIVCVIIGVLAAIAIPAFLEQREAAWTAACRSDARNGAAAATAFAADNGGSYSPGGVDMTATDLTGDYGWNISTNAGVGNPTVTVPDPANYVITVDNTNLPAGSQTCTFNSANGFVEGPTP